MVAVSLGGIEHHVLDPQIPLILKCLFGIGFQKIPIRKGSGHGYPYWGAREVIYKRNDSPVDMNLFGMADFVGISAIIYSKENILDALTKTNKIGDRFVFVFNHSAKNSLPKNIFEFGTHYEKLGVFIRSQNFNCFNTNEM